MEVGREERSDIKSGMGRILLLSINYIFYFFKLNCNNLFILNYTIFRYFFLLKLFYKIWASRLLWKILCIVNTTCNILLYDISIVGLTKIIQFDKNVIKLISISPPCSILYVLNVKIKRSRDIKLFKI